MRHKRIKFSRLRRATDQRTALLRGLTAELLCREKIKTTYQKAVSAKRLAEKIISLSKRGDLPSRRRIFSLLANDRRMRGKLDSLAQRCGDRESGWIRITKLGSRAGDNAPLALLELI